MKNFLLGQFSNVLCSNSLRTPATSQTEKIVELPWIQTQEKIIEVPTITQQVVNTDVRHVVNAVGVVKINPQECVENRRVEGLWTSLS